MSENNKSRDWAEIGTGAIVVLSALLTMLAQHRKPAQPVFKLRYVAPWAGVIVTLVAFVLHATWNASKVDSAIAGQAAAIAAQGVRMDRVLADYMAHQQQNETVERKVDFLCDERRRDNDEAGRTTTGAPC
jgi:hypothetical protein